MGAPTLTIMCGGSGAGKSTIRRERFADVPVVDCDLIKREHPEYDAKAPAGVHDWSSEQATRRVLGFLSRSESVVFDSTGTNLDKLLMLVNVAHAVGMNVHAVLVTCTVDTAIARDKARERNVGEAIVREKHRAVSLAWPVVRSLADSSEVIDNETPRTLEAKP